MAHNKYSKQMEAGRAGVMLVSVNQVKIRVFCLCCIILTVYQGSNLFKKRHQNTRLLALSIVLFAILQFSPSGFAFAFVGF